MGQIVQYTPQQTTFRLYMKQLYKVDKTTYYKKTAEYKELLQKLVYQKQYNRSTCISKKICTRIMKSIDYTIEHAPIFQSTSYMAVFQHSLISIYNAGMQFMKQEVSQAQQLYTVLCSHPIEFQNERYQSILHEQIPHFFSQYELDIDYAAHLVYDDFDYPLLDGLPLYHNNYLKRGIDFVLTYLQRLWLEQQYILCFSKEMIHDFIVAYEYQKGIEVTLIGCNLCEMLFLQQILSSSIPNKHDIVLTHLEMDYIWQNIQRSSTFLYEQINNVITQLPLLLQTYFHTYVEVFYQHIQAIHSFEHLANMGIYLQPAQVATIQLTPSCDPSLYHDFLENIHNTQDPSRIVQYINETPLGPYDYLDMLSSNLLDETTYQLLFTSMEDNFIAMLYYFAYQDDLRFQIQNPLDPHFLSTLTQEDEWQIYFILELMNRSDRAKQQIQTFLSQLKLANMN